MYDSRCRSVGWISSVVCLLAASAGLLGTHGCVSDEVPYQAPLITYQRGLADQGPQPRRSDEDENLTEPNGLLVPVASDWRPPVSELNIRTDPNTGHKTVSLTLEQAITNTLANSPDIRVVSFDPEIARQEIRKAVGEFDPIKFSQVSYDNQDSPQNSYFEPGRADKRLFETGLRQRTTIGSEWSASYALARNWDDLYRVIPTRYEPMLIFQLKQPLLRDAGPGVNLAGVDTAKLGYQVALLGFRDKAESVAADVMVAYWRLVQALRIVEVQRQLVEETLQTLHKVENRREIDATDVQVMQARTYAKLREADLLDAEKLAKDAQDMLVRLIADPQVNTTSEVTVVPVTMPEMEPQLPETARTVDKALTAAMLFNPAVLEARMRIEMAEINVRVAENQQLPRVDLVGSMRAQGLASESSEAHDQIWDGQYTSYTVALSIEIPVGNRQREAELTLRHLEQRKAVSILHSTADQIAVQVKEKIRKAHTAFLQVNLEKQAAQAAQSQLKALEESEPIREKLTPEFLLVKLQAQETYAQAQRAQISVQAEFNIALAELARTTGTVLRMQRVDEAMTTVIEHAED